MLEFLFLIAAITLANTITFSLIWGLFLFIALRQMNQEEEKKRQE